jgi:hypothetical protein
MATMKPVVSMAIASIASCALAAIVLDPATSRAVLLGMAGPLVAVTSTWIAVEWAARRDLARVTPVMFVAFAVKMVFFGAYVTIVVKRVAVPPISFVVSFISYFITLYVIEALYLQRRLLTGLHQPE